MTDTREAFELAYTSAIGLPPLKFARFDNGDYCDDDAKFCYKLWQACEAHYKERIAELEKAQPVPYHEVVEALMLMAWQYLERIDGTIDHQFMSAGEQTEEVLERLGIIKNGVILEKFKENGAIDQAIAESKG